MKTPSPLAQHMVAGLLVAVVTALAVCAEEVARAAWHDVVLWRAAATALAILCAVALPLGAWLGLVLWGARRDWAPFDLLEWVRAAVSVQDREEETQRVSSAVGNALGLAAWGVSSWLATRVLVARIVRPELEAVVVPAAILVLASVSWGTARALSRGLSNLLALREELVEDQLGVVSLPALLGMAACAVVGVAVALRGGLLGFLYRLDADPVWALAAGTGAALVALLVLGTDPGERLAVRLASPLPLFLVVVCIGAGGTLALARALDREPLREALFWQHGTAASVVTVFMPDEDADVDVATEASAPDDAPPVSGNVEPPSTDPPATPEGPPRTRPNILFLTMDTVRADALGMYGYTRHPTSPRLDAWSAGGMRFQRAYSAAPCSSASFMGMLTSTLPSRLRGVTLEGDVFSMPSGVTTLAQRLSRAGYHARALIPVIPNYLRGIQRGFAQFDESFHYAEVLADRGIRAVEQAEKSDQPQFLWVHFVDAHHPYEPHKPFTHFGNAPRDLYAQEVAYMDGHLGRVLDAADASRWVVFVFADHGEAFGERGTQLHGNSLTDEEVRVPLLVRGPGVLAGSVSEPVSLLDLGPTVMELAGITPPEGLGGRSLVPALQGHTLHEQRVLMEGCKPGTMMAMVEGGRKLIYRRRSGLHHLFDLAVDPAERRNLFQSVPEREDLRRVMMGVFRGR